MKCWRKNDLVWNEIHAIHAFLQWKTCLQWNAIAYNGDITSMRNYRMRETYERLRQQSLEGYWKLYCTCDSQSHPTSNDDVTGTHTACLSRSLLFWIETLKQSPQSQLLCVTYVNLLL